MRAISAALVAAQNETGREPAISLKIEDHLPIADRLNWTQTGATGPEKGPHQACLCGGGWFARAIVGADGIVWFTRDNLAGSTSGWVQLAAGARVDAQSVTVFSYIADANKLVVAWVHADTHTVSFRLSTDNGDTWAAPVQVCVLAGNLAVNAIAGIQTHATDDRFVIFVAVDDTITTGFDGYVIAYRFLNGAANGAVGEVDRHRVPWGLAAARTPTNPRLVYLLLTSAENNTGFLDSLYWSDLTGAWGTMAALHYTGEAAGFVFDNPTLEIHTQDSFTRILYGWSITDVTLGTQRHVFSWTMDRTHLTPWLTPPFPSYGAYNLTLLYAAGAYYLVGPTISYQSGPYVAPPGGGTAALGGLVKGFALEREELKAGKLTLVLDDDGRFAHCGQAGDAYEPIRAGSQVILGTGYRLADGSLGYAYDADWWIVRAYRRQIRRQPRQKQGTAELVVECTDCWGYLEAQTQASSFTWNNYSYFQVFDEVMKTVTPGVYNYPNAAIDILLPRLKADHGDTLAEPLRRHLPDTGNRLAVQSQQLGRGGLDALRPWFIPVDNWQAANHHHIGGDGQPILESVDDPPPAPPNRIVVASDDCLSEVLDLEAMQAAQREVSAFHYRPELASVADCALVAEMHQLGHQYRRRRTAVTIPYNVAAELGDCVELTDDWLGLVAAQRHIHRIKGTYDAQRGIYETTLWLDGQA
ncbi:MAG: hypothetical protein M0Z94_12650 [Dehalococcoidales bacterium]|nr:hypothetical protein [Dehalococcoidales bacterium]